MGKEEVYLHYKVYGLQVKLMFAEKNKKMQRKLIKSTSNRVNIKEDLVKVEIIWLKKRDMSPLSN